MASIRPHPVPGQKLPSCVCKEDENMHPSVGIGRGAPEIDALEASVDMNISLGTASQSYQIVGILCMRSCVSLGLLTLRL